MAGVDLMWSIEGQNSEHHELPLFIGHPKIRSLGVKNQDTVKLDESLSYMRREPYSSSLRIAFTRVGD